MNEEQYKKVTEIFHQAADLDGEAREAFLDQACEGDAELRCQVERLLGHDDPREDALLDQRPEVGSVLLDGVTAGSPRSPLPVMPPPDRIGPYRILEKIGEGGMGTVYLAEQDHPQRKVAVKMIRAGLCSPGLLKRFRFEADVLGRLKHPGIAQIYEAGEMETESGPIPYFVMEHVEGVELRRFVIDHELDVRARLELVARIADGVHHAHQQGIVHRDLKPDNVLVVKAGGTRAAGDSQEFAGLGRPKILDFGVARATDSDMQVTTLQTDAGQLVGTLTYMSPEQVEGDSNRLDERSDIYALGVILYELLAGRPPLDLREKSIPEAGRIIREEDPTRLGAIRTDFRGDIDTMTCKALEKDRDHRYLSASALAVDIRRYLANEPIFAHPPSALYQLKKFAKRHKGLVAGLLLAFLILLAGIVVSLILAVRATRGEADARNAAYRLSITATEAMSDANPKQALKHLATIPAEFRGWEWRHLHARLNAHAAECTGTWSGIAFRADGQLVAPRVRDGAVELVEMPAGRVQMIIRAPEKLSLPEISSLGDRLVTLAEVEKKLILWDAATGQRLKEIPVSDPRIRMIRVSPNAAYIVCIYSKPEIIAFEVATGRQLFRVPLDSNLRTFTFDSTGDRFALTTKENLNLHSSTGELLRQRKTWNFCMSMTFSPDGSQLALGELHRLTRIVDGSTLEEQKSIYGHADRVSGLAFSPDGRRLATASLDGTARLLNYDTGQVERVFMGLPYGTLSLAFSRDSRSLAVASNTAIRVFILDLEARRVLEGHENYVYHVTFNHDGSLLASCAFYEKVRLWNGLTGKPLAVISSRRPQRFIGFTPDGSRLLTFDKFGTLVWDPAVGLPLTAPRTASDEPLSNDDFDFWTAAAAGSKATLDAGERLASNPDRTLLAEGTYRAVSKLMGGSLDSLDDSREEILIKDLATGEIIRRMGNFECPVLSVDFSPDGKRLASGLQNGIVHVWDFVDGKVVATMKGHTSDVYSIDHSPDGTRMVTGGNDGMIILWDTASHEQVLVLSGHKSYVHSVCFSPDGTLIASGSGDGTVRLWDSVPPVERMRELEKFREKRGEAEALVEGLLKELGDPFQVAHRLRADSSLGDALRRAALQVLLERSQAP